MSRNITIVGDAGSCWLGRKEFGFRLIKAAKEAGCDACKFQLFEGEPYVSNGNIELPIDLFMEFYQYGKEVGIPVTASVFNKEALEKLMMLPELHHIKFGYSMRHQYEWIRAALYIGKKVVVSTNVLDLCFLPSHVRLVKLFVNVDNRGPIYPSTVQTQFQGLFPDRFDGYSDHSLGYLEAQRAVNEGATWIEKHLRLEDIDCEDVPDGRFALTPKQMTEFVWKMRP